MALQLIGILLLAWCSIAPRPRPSTDQPLPARSMDMLVLVAILVVLAQLIPLPASVWTELPGRSAVADGFEQLGYDLPALPVALTPHASVAALFAAIPAIAAFLAVRILAVSPRAIAVAVVTAMVLAVILGTVQVAGGPGSWAYLYRFTNEGAVGFFANRNHMATLLLVSIPLITALLASAKSDEGSSAAGRYATGIALLFLVIVGIALNGSMAALALAAPVALASASLVSAGARWRSLVPAVTAAALLAGVGVLVFSPIASMAVQVGASESVTGRTEIWATTVEAIKNSFPVGTGLGSFEQVYRFNEDSALVSGHYVNHAHNDYLQLILELGLPGMLLILLFLAWWLFAAVRIWASPSSSAFERAATIATAAVLAHSVVDFPLRTAALSAVFAALVAVMAQHFATPIVRRKGEARAVRHVSLG